jgi:hypothetical protein
VPFCCWFLVDHASQHGWVHITITPNSAILVSWLTHTHTHACTHACTHTHMHTCTTDDYNGKAVSSPG